MKQFSKVKMNKHTEKTQQKNQAIAKKLDKYLQACLTNGYFMGSVLVARGGEVF